MKRTVVAVILWSLVILAFIFSFRSSTVTTTILQRFNESMPPDQVKEYILATEFGREYIREWATWHPEETSELRKARLEPFNAQLNLSAPINMQQPFHPTSVTVTNCTKENDDYHVKALVLGGQTPIAFSTVIGFQEGNPYAKSLPMLAAAPTASTGPDNPMHGRIDEQVRVFTQRFLQAYLEGESESDTTIFTTPGTSIAPAGNSKLVRLEEVYGNGSKKPGTVKVIYQATLNGATIKQEMTLHLTWKDDKPLINRIEP